MRRIFRRLASDVIDLPQFYGHGELHKERFDKLIGLINSKRRQSDVSALVSCVSQRVLRSIGAICSDVNRHVRFENRRIVLAGEIVNDSLKEGACRLGRDKPVCNNGLAGHEATRSCSTPLLQLDNVTFGIARIDQTNQTGAFYFRGSNFTHRATAGYDHCL